MDLEYRYVASPTPRVLPWLDDFAFFLTGTRCQALAARDASFDTLALLGITRNVGKGQPEPSRMLHDHLGYGIDSANMRFLLTTKRERKLRASATAILGCAVRHRRLVGKRQLAGLAGLAQSTHLALPLVRLWLRSTYDDISSRPGWSTQVRLSRQSLTDLRHLTTLRTCKHVGRPITLLPDTAVGWVDAGPRGWGGRLLSRQDRVAGFWSAWEAGKHITFRELRAVRLFLEHYVHSLRGRRLLLWEDNQAVVGILRGFTTRSAEPAMRADLEEIIGVLEAESILLSVRYIRSKDNPADWWSRVQDKSEWRLHQSVADGLVHRFGVAQIDRFADSSTALLRRFNAAYPCRGAEAVDAFSVSWEGSHSWINPPWNLVGKALYKLWMEPAASATLLLPVWPTASWWALLQRLMTACEPVQLPAWAFVPGPLMAQTVGMQPEPLLNSGWRLQLVFVGARAAVAESLYSEALIFSSVLAVRSPRSCSV